MVDAQSASPTFTHVYAAFIAIINTKVRFHIQVISPMNNYTCSMMWDLGVTYILLHCILCVWQIVWRSEIKKHEQYGNIDRLICTVYKLEFSSSVSLQFPQNGELILRRLITNFKKGYRRNDKKLCLSSTRFIAHLVNQQVVRSKHSILSPRIMIVMMWW